MTFYNFFVSYCNIMVIITKNFYHSLAGSEHVHYDLFVVFKGEYLKSKQSIDFWILATQKLAFPCKLYIGKFIASLWLQ